MKVAILTAAVLSGLFALASLLDSLAALALPLMLLLVAYDLYIAFFYGRPPRGDSRAR